MSKTVLVLGSFVADVAFRASRLPAWGETLMGSAFALGPGGKGSNQAVAAARAGARVQMVSKLGNDPFGARLDEAVHGEHIDQHPLLVRRFRNVGEIGDCRILYIDRSKSGDLAQILTALDHRATLTVSELDGSAERGVTRSATSVPNLASPQTHWRSDRTQRIW